MDEDRGFRSIKVLLAIFCLIGSSFTLIVFTENDIDGWTLQQPLAQIEKTGNWSVTGTETYSNSTIQLNGNLSISGTLILDSTELVINSSGSSLKAIKVTMGGSFTIRNGSSISGLDGRRYLFISDAGSNVMINRSTIFHCGIRSTENSFRGIYTRSTNFQVLDSMIMEGETGLIGDGAKILMRRTDLSGLEGDGIELFDGAHLDAAIINVTNCIDHGIDLTSSTMDLANGYFENLDMSIWSLNSTMNITGSFITGSGQHSIIFNSTKATMMDTNPSLSGISRILVSQPAGIGSNILLLNCTFFTVFNRDVTGDVKKALRFDVKVLTNGLEPAENADIEIKDISRKVVYQGLTNEFGYIEDIPLAVAYFNLSGGQPLTPHNVSVFYEGATRQKDVDASGYHFVQVNVILSDPDVMIDYPVDGEWIPTGSFYLNGRVEDMRPITDIWMSIDGSPEILIPNNNPFSVQLELPDGEHEVRIVAKNDDGKFGWINMTFGIDTVAPTITINSPAMTSYTNSSYILIYGICSPDADLFVDGIMVNHPDGEFTASYLLKEGWNNILVNAIDRAGNTKEMVLKVYKDGTPPKIFIFTPLNDTRISTDEVLVHGSTDIDTQILWINGEEVELDMGEFEKLVENLQEGSNRVSIVAQDLTGAKTTRFITIIVDTEPPNVRITEAPLLTNENSATVRGKTEPGSTIYVNNNIVLVEDGEFAQEVDLIEGINNITIFALDDLGNSNLVYHTIILDIEAPIFDQVKPSSGSEFTNPILEIVCHLYDENGISLVRGRSGSGPFENISTESEFNWIVTLLEGDNFFDIEATDKAGNTALKQLIYKHKPKVSGEDTESPIVMITTPLLNETWEEGTILVEGWAMDDAMVSSVHIRIDEGDWMEVQGITTWSLEIDLEKGIYHIQARAVDSSGNEGFDSVWTRIYIDSADDDDSGSDKASTSLMIIVISLFVLMAVIVFGYLLYIRNRNLRSELVIMREENERKEKGTRRQADHRTRRPVRERRPPRHE